MTITTPLVKLAAATVLVLLAACGAQPEAPEGAEAEVATYALGGDRTIDVSDGFVRPVAAGAMSTAGYLTLTASQPVAIIGARAEGFASVELHDVTMDGAVMRMRPIERIEVGADQPTALAPGERHLMMMSPAEALEVGDVVTVTLLFDDGAETTVTLPVQRR